MSLDLTLTDDHPLVRELASLRNAVLHYQREAHGESVKLQRHSLETARALQRLHVLENENSYLRSELDVHRAHPDDSAGLIRSGSHRDSLQVQELTLVLRRLSDKLDLTEKILLSRNDELAAALVERDASKLAMENAFAVAVRLRGQLEMCRAGERDLLNRVKAAEEERNIIDSVVEEYASLVRALEGRSSSNTLEGDANGNGQSSRQSLDGLSSARFSLQKLLQESYVDSEKLHTEIARLHGALETLEATLDAERKVAENERRKLALAQIEVHRLRTDDNAAAKMVSRYMKFSQASTDALHTAIENMKSRHAATLFSCESRLHQSEELLSSEARQSERLRKALDELSEDISREAYGRRREISLRLALLAREEAFSEKLRRWLLRGREAECRADSSGQSGQAATFTKLLDAAEGISMELDGPALTDGVGSPGSFGRVLAAQSAVAALADELRGETDRRLSLERQLSIQQAGSLKANYDSRVESAMCKVSPDSAIVSKPAVATEATVPVSATSQRFLSTSFATSSDHPLKRPLSADPMPSTLAPLSATILSDSRIQPDQLPIKPYSAPSLLTTIPTTKDNPANSSELDRPVNPSESNKPALTEEPMALLETSSLEVSAPTAPDVAIYQGTSKLVSPKISVNSAPPFNAEAVLFDASSVENLVSVSVLPDSISPNSVSVLPPGEGEEIHIEVETSPLAIREPFSVLIKPPEPRLGDGRDRIEGGDVLEAVENEIPLVQDNDKRECAIEHSELKPKANANSVDIPQIERHKNHIPFPVSLLELPSDLTLMGDLPAKVNSPPKDPFLDSLLSDLSQADRRYNDLQRSFRDCHLSLRQLKLSITELPSSSDAFQIIADRLDDYCEDARVELEIRIADEERITRGYQTLLSVPGALSDEVNKGEMKCQIKAFIDGSDPAVHKTIELLKHKLDDLQHDIASVKQAIFNPQPPSPSIQQSVPPEDVPKTPTSGWASWTGSILSSSRSPSPAPAPTFGAVMTSPRLRHSSSFQRTRTDSDSAKNPFAALGLRIPMPSQVLPPPNPPTHSRMTPRPRVSSTMFSLGLGSGGGGLLSGSRRSSLAFNAGGLSGSTTGHIMNTEITLDSDLE